MGTTVLLLHTMPDGSWHFDWLFEPTAGAAALQSFRVVDRIDAAEPPATFEAVATPPHRPVYLIYEGPISGDRGTVAQVACGRISVEWSSADGTELGVGLDWGNGVHRYEGKSSTDGAWRFILV